MLSFAYLQPIEEKEPIIKPLIKKKDSLKIRIFKRAKELINNGWCQGKYHCRKWFFLHKYCVVGALRQAVKELKGIDYEFSLVNRFRPLFSPYIFGDSIEKWNDDISITKKDVLNVFDVLIDKYSCRK